MLSCDAHNVYMAVWLELQLFRLHSNVLRKQLHRKQLMNIMYEKAE
jgi:hypothetical protein